MKYLGFCTQQTIVINLSLLLSRAKDADTTHELVLTICHEVAHLRRGGGYGSEWRATQIGSSRRCSSDLRRLDLDGHVQVPGLRQVLSGDWSTGQGMRGVIRCVVR